VSETTPLPYACESVSVSLTAFIVEQPDPGAHDDRVHEEPKLVEQGVAHQRPDESAAAVDHDVLAVLVGQLGWDNGSRLGGSSAMAPPGALGCGRRGSRTKASGGGSASRNRHSVATHDGNEGEPACA
jgi:hypothetical protein